MRITIGKKLGFGFGIVITLIAACAGVALRQLSVMDKRLDETFHQAFPATQAGAQALTGIAEARAAMRGYLILSLLGGDTEEEKAMLQRRTAAWDKVDTAVGELVALSKSWPDEKSRQQLERIQQTVTEVRDIQRQIEELLRRAENIPATQLMVAEAAPRAAEILETLADIVKAEISREPAAERKPLLQGFSDVRSSFSECVGDLRAYLGTGETSDKQEFEKHWRAYTQAVHRTHEMAPLFSSAERPLWERYTRLHSEFDPLVARVIALREAKDWNRAVHLWETESKPRVDALGAMITNITELASNNLMEARTEVRAAGDLVDFSLIVATTASILIGCIVAIVLGRKIAVTTRLLADRAGEISSGDLRGEKLSLKTTDELGDLAGGFNIMLENLKELTKQILSVTENVNTATTQIATSTKQQASSTKEQAATVQQITMTMKELNQSGAQIVEKAKEVAAAAESVSESSRSGIDAVLETNRTMETIREQVEEVAENIVALSEKTQAVGEIIATVNDIAEQSNLLALNASIEAAGAGDDGNRFSVVASEMKNLADQAKECTVQVRGILGEIQKGINTAVMLTEEAVKRVDAGKQQSDISERTIREMVSTTQSSVEAYQQIIGATNQQQVGFEQVSKGMQDIDLAARQTATSTAQLEQALGDLSAMSHQLRAAVTTYRV